MHHIATASKALFLVGSGFVSALVEGGGVHSGLTAGQLLTGGGGIILGLSILKGVSEVGRLRQVVEEHERRLERVERLQDRDR